MRRRRIGLFAGWMSASGLVSAVASPSISIAASVPDDLAEAREWLTSYSQASNRGEERKFFAPGARIWVGNKSGDGRVLGDGRFDPWERAAHAKWEYELLETADGGGDRGERQSGDSEPGELRSGDTGHAAGRSRRSIIARVTETSDFLKLLPPGRTEGHVTYERDAAGLVTGIVYRPIGPRTREMILPFAAWAQIHIPEERRVLLPDGEIAYRAELLPRWLAALRQWRSEADPSTLPRLVAALDAYLAAGRADAADAGDAAEAARHREKARRLAPGARIWFEDRTGEGSPINLESADRGWDEELHARSTYTNPRGGGDVVAADFIEKNDFYELLGVSGWKATITFRFDPQGRVLEEVYVPVAGQPATRDLLAPVVAWASRAHPDELEAIYPAKARRLLRNREMAKRWRTLLTEYSSAKPAERLPG